MSEELKKQPRGLQGLEDIEPLPELPNEHKSNFDGVDSGNKRKSGDEELVGFVADSEKLDDSGDSDDSKNLSKMAGKSAKSSVKSSAKLSSKPSSESSIASLINANANKGSNESKAINGSKPINGSTFINGSKASGASDDSLSPLDPLLSNPRISTRIWCVVCGLIMVAAAFGLWWLAVRTQLGQSYEEMVIEGFGENALPSWLSLVLAPLRKSVVIVSISVLIGCIALVIAIVRKRWWLIGQCVVIVLLSLSSEPLKKILPRELLVNIETLAKNSAPSGHTLLVACACALLVCCVTRTFRAWTALIAAVFTCLVAYSLMAGKWHRPTDVIMSLLLVGAASLFALAASRKSGMDIPGSRRSSVSVQIIGTSMITFGLLFCIYATYLVWQILPGVGLFARWAEGVSYLSVYWAVAGVSLLVFGVVMVLRQASAAPLSRLGLVGAPPTPPSSLAKSQYEEKSQDDKLSALLSSANISDTSSK
ncbi:phosphatase PAP2 family protein [Gardnerella vaginalis]|nr:phosphatase PAP2 family protein [Gardnerella vaginalis]